MPQNFFTQYLKSLQPNPPDAGEHIGREPSYGLILVSAAIRGTQEGINAFVSALYSLPFEGNWSLICSLYFHFYWYFLSLYRVSLKVVVCAHFILNINSIYQFTNRDLVHLKDMGLLLRSI